MNTPNRDAYRLTPSDEDRVTEAIRATLQRWHDNQSTPGLVHLTADLVLTLERIGCNSIGCSLFDLRDSEMTYVRNEIDRLADQIGAE